MFKYDTPQKVYEVGRAKVRWKPWRIPDRISGFHIL